jgi:hypothetical protein
MLTRLNPDDLEDVGDFIGDLCDLCDKNMKQRGMCIQDVCFALIFLGIDIAFDGGFSIKEIERLNKETLRLIREKRKSQ